MHCEVNGVLANIIWKIARDSGIVVFEERINMAIQTVSGQQTWGG
jgi:hypothetical protein